MAFLVLFNLIEVWHIIVLSLIFGVISAFDAPARQALVIDLIDNPAENLSNAIALNSALFNGARLVGPAIAGLIIAYVGEGICFLLYAVSFISVILALMQIKIKPKTIEVKIANFKKSLSDGFKYTFRSVPIRTLIILLAVLSLAAFPFIVVLPAFAKEILSGSSDTLGFLMSALGAGALAGALYMASRNSVLGLCKIISLNTLLLGVTIFLMSFSVTLVISLLILAVGGFSMIMTLSAINTLLQTITEDDKRGRVMSFYAMALMGTLPIGNLMMGSLASIIGIPHSLLIGGVITILSAVWFIYNQKTFASFVKPIYLKKGILLSP